MTSSCSASLRPGLGPLLVLVCAFTTAFSVPVHAQKIKLATLVPDGSIWDRALKEMGAQWSKKTSGRVSLRIFAGGVAGDETDMLRKLKIGQLQAGLFTASGLGQMEPAFRIFEVPLLFETEEEVTYVVRAVKEDFEKRLEKRGYHMLHWAHAGWVRIFSTGPIERYEDFIGMKQFVWGGGTRIGKWYEEVGIRTVPLAAPDILTGLQTGLVDVVPSTPLTALSLQWFRSAPFMCERRLAPLIGGTVISNRAWKKVTPHDQVEMLAAARKAGTKLFSEVPRSEGKALAEMKKRGLRVTQVASAEDRRRWEGLGEHFKTRMREDSVPRDVFDRVTGLLKEYRAAKEKDD